MANVKKGHKLGIFALAMINIAVILSLQTLPELAEYGYAIIFYMALVCLCFFVPSALVAAELASGWPQNGGIFLWVKEAFGPKWGFIAVFTQWVQNLVVLPSVLAFVASSIAYLFNPALSSNKLFVTVVIWISIWIATLLNFRSMKLSSFCSSSGVILGTIIPGVLLIALSAKHVFLGKPLAITFSYEALVPKLNSLNQLMLLAGIMISITGMEMPAVHIANVENPKKNFAKAIFIACFITIFLYVIGPLSIAIVIPTTKLSLNAGVMQGFEALFNIHETKWATPIIAVLLAYGVLTSIVTLLVAPSKAIKEVAKRGYLPRYMQIDNKYGMPTGTLMVQACLATILSFVVLLMPTVRSAFWIMTALATQLYLIMYLLMFAAAIKLRYSQPNTERSYKIPGGNIGMWLTSGIAFLTSLFVIIFGFIPTEAMREKGTIAMVSYIAFLVVGIVVFVGIPILLYHRATKNRKQTKNLL